MKIKSIPIILLPLLLVLYGCSLNAPQQQIPELRSGIQGLEFEFLKNAPPPIVFEESSFPAILRVKNIGAYSIENEQALLTLGVERDYTKKVIVETGGKVVSEASGEMRNEATFTLPGKTLIATLCYPYETALITSVCIDPDPNGIRPTKKSCTVQDVSFPQGQGAPV